MKIELGIFQLTTGNGIPAYARLVHHSPDSTLQETSWRPPPTPVLLGWLDLRAETCPVPPSPMKMQKSLHFLPSPRGCGVGAAPWGWVIQAAGSVPDPPMLNEKKSPCPSGLPQFPSPVGVSFFNRLTVNTLILSSLDNTCYLSCLHQPHSGSTHTDGLASRSYGAVTKAIRPKKWQPDVPMQLLDAWWFPSQNTRWTLGCFMQAGGDGWREKHKALSSCNLERQWSHWAAKCRPVLEL